MPTWVVRVSGSVCRSFRKKKKRKKKFVRLNAQIPLLHVHRYVYIIAEALIIDKLPLSISTGLDCCVHWNRNFGFFCTEASFIFLATAAVFSYHYVAGLWFITWRPIIVHHHHHPWTTIMLYIFSRFRAKRKKTVSMLRRLLYADVMLLVSSYCRKKQIQSSRGNGPPIVPTIHALTIISESFQL